MKLDHEASGCEAPKMSIEYLPSTEHFKVDLNKMLQHHLRRARAYPNCPQMRRFHLKAAIYLGEKISRKQNQPWTWEEFLEAHQPKLTKTK